ncbi:MAG TPA: LacI family DNA-binding transcriptional regulator [Acidobacteriaceae bacterium]
MKPPSIKDIAEALGVSIGTVDRALHGRTDVSPTTRARVLKKAEQIGYQPNIAARSLKLNRRLRIGVYLPREIASFFDPLRSGVRAAASAPTGVNVELVFRTFPRLDEGDLALFTADADQKFDGIIVAPGNPDHIGSTLNALARRKIPVICVASDAPRSERLASVTADAHASGAIAAEIFSRTIQKTGHLATITGELTTLDHVEKVRGFAANLAVFAPNLSLLPAIESHEQPKLAYRQTIALLSRKPYPLGIYISTANSIPVLRALEEKNLLGKIQVITTDLFPELIPYIESGKILATLYQRPFTQGKTALELLFRYLIDGVTPATLARFAPHIILRSNLALFASYLGDSGDAST